ncbi:putative reverse transcriptase domain-containing protein [Tanacetum coccineum]
MFMTIQSSVKDKILATPSETSKVENAPAEMLRDLDQQMEKRADDGCTLWIKLYSKYEYEIRYNPDAAESVSDAIRFEYCLASSSGWTNIRCAPFEALYGRKGRSRVIWAEMHPQADGQSERMIQTLEDILRACVINFGGSYHLSIWCAPFEALYRRKCRSPVLWAEIREGSVIGPELVLETTDKVVLIKEKLQAARDRQKSNVNYRRKMLEFEVRDHVLLKVSPWKDVVRFGKKGKLAQRYVGPFEILERNGLVAYRLRLPKELNSVHDNFHVSNLKKCLADASLHVPLDEIKVDKTLCFVEEPVEIMDREN